MRRRSLALGLALITAVSAQTTSQQEPEPRLKSRTEVEHPPVALPSDPDALLIVPAGTKIPLQLRQPVSTKGAQAGDAIYAQTTFPIVMNGRIAIPAGTWVQGVVDSVKRAGRIKGTARLQFHLTTLVYANGYTVDIAAAIAKVPGDMPTRMKEPGTINRDPEKGKDLERVGDAASKAAQIGTVAGVAANQSITGLAAGGLAGIAAGTLIALLARGSDVTFPTGTAVEIALTRAFALERDKASMPASMPAGFPAQ